LIVVDSSALLAIYLDEPEGPVFARSMVSADGPLIGAQNLVEASMIAEGRNGERGCRDLDRLIEALDIKVVDFGRRHVEAAREAFRRFGKCRHRAALNFGDCCAYALAKTLDVPLLFKGNDFALTDIQAAL
jgi:ribonuclease VapC